MPKETLVDIAAALEAKANEYERGSKTYYEEHPDVKGAKEEEHSSGAMRARLAQVYRKTAQGVRELNQQHERDFLRAENPYFAELTDEEADKIIARQHERERSFYEERGRKRNS